MSQAYKTTDLAPDERFAIERLLGRQLQSDEAVEVVTRKIDELSGTPEAMRRKQAATRIVSWQRARVSAAARFVSLSTKAAAFDLLYDGSRDNWSQAIRR